MSKTIYSPYSLGTERSSPAGADFPLSSHRFFFLLLAAFSLQKELVVANFTPSNMLSLRFLTEFPMGDVHSTCFYLCHRSGGHRLVLGTGSEPPLIQQENTRQPLVFTLNPCQKTDCMGLVGWQALPAHLSVPCLGK